MKLFRRLSSILKEREGQKDSLRDFENGKALEAVLQGKSSAMQDAIADESALSVTSVPTMPIPEVEWKLPIVDTKASEPQSMEEELKRLKVLESYFILDSDREDDFDRLTRLACMTFDVPTSIISLVDLGRQWNMSTVGLDASELPRKHSLCAHVVLNKFNMLVVPDASKDFRFRDNPFVTGEPHLRFYAGAALVTPEGFKLGTICLISPTRRPMGLAEREQKMLHEMAGIVVNTMVARRDRLIKKNYERKLEDVGKVLADASASMLRTSECISSGCSNALRERAVMDIDTQVQICAATARSLLEKDEEAPGGPEKKGGGIDDLESRLDDIMEPKTDLAALVVNLGTVLKTFPHKSAVTLELDAACPTLVVAEDLLLFRSCLNLVSHSMQRADKSGNVHFRIRQKKGNILFEVEDTGTIVSKDRGRQFFHEYDSLLAPVATMARTMEGNYGMRLGRLHGNAEGSKRTIFVFQMPLIIPESVVDYSTPASKDTKNGKAGVVIYFPPKMEAVPRAKDATLQEDPFRAALIQTGCITLNS